MIPAPIRGLFSLLDAAAIDSVVLRGYRPVEDVAASMDIDVFIAARDRRRTDETPHRAGWLARRYQTGRHPHRFYDNFEVPGRVCTMLDVVYGPHYGDRLNALANPERVLAASESFEGVRVPPRWIALFTFALHVLLDKGTLSDNNARRALREIAAGGRAEIDAHVHSWTSRPFRAEQAASEPGQRPSRRSLRMHTTSIRASPRSCLGWTVQSLKCRSQRGFRGCP